MIVGSTLPFSYEWGSPRFGVDPTTETRNEMEYSIICQKTQGKYLSSHLYLES
jgi:hypothetical protein